ncbi:anthocyanidin 3-O-glucosyltransferase 2-like [Andrographis paniculata]|uniref:anthocyanidin 3-O-glucosyltransferase 2-like n=1 Tax=Andrographis paniculata TaxID=175694 RepID=UPI001E7DC3FF|nr:anthocyanidin 3-O-glucosyltransferase 2-like [Andrographis paniculata]QZJ84674.1 UDP-glycosyltransferase 3 [Andrographis paniculata]
MESAHSHKHHLIFLPSPGSSHLVPALNFGNLILSRNSSLRITYLLIADLHTPKPSHNSILPIPNPCLQFLNLPKPETPVSSSFHDNKQKLASVRSTEYINRHRPQVRKAVDDIVKNSGDRIVGLVVDMFCVSMIDVGDEFGIPSYVFYTSSATFLAFKMFFLRLRDEHGQDITEYKDSDHEFQIPGFVNPVPAKVMPSMMLDKNGGSELVMECARQIRKTKGIIINTMEEMDATAIRTLIDSKGEIPPIYPIGPVIDLVPVRTRDERIEDDSIIGWLDAQPPSSVVFLCFGSQGTFPAPQIEHLACAIELCGYRFLWSLRSPKGGTAEEILPEGFLERSSCAGRVIGWAPQAAVLSHPAVGGFVSHCGWNSVLESVWFGVPIAAWPMAAEQQVNAFHIVKELGIAVEIKMDYRGDVDSASVVEAELVEKAIRAVMGRESIGIRKKIRVLRERGLRGLMAGGGGSWEKFMEKLIHDSNSSAST